MDCRDWCWAQGALFSFLLGSPPFSGGAGCIPMSYCSLRAEAGTRLYPKCLAVTLLGSCFPLQGVQLLDWTCKQDSVTSGSGAG